jgi:hypothetical protein
MMPAAGLPTGLRIEDHLAPVRLIVWFIPRGVFAEARLQSLAMQPQLGRVLACLCVVSVLV